MSKVAFICVPELKGLCESVGMDAFVIEEKRNPCRVLAGLPEKGYSIAYILERLARDYVKEIDDIRKEGAFSVVILPDHISDFGLGMELTRLATIDAIGTDAMSAENRAGL